MNMSFYDAKEGWVFLEENTLKAMQRCWLANLQIKVYNFTAPLATMLYCISLEVADQLEFAGLLLKSLALLFRYVFPSKYPYYNSYNANCILSEMP